MFKKVHNNDKESPAESDNLNDDVTSNNEASEINTDVQSAQPPSTPKYNSLELRRLPVNALLKPENILKSIRNFSQLDTEEEEENVLKSSSSEKPRGILRMTVLNPNFGLGTQLLLVFGSVSAFIIAFVLISSVIIARHSGENLKAINQGRFEDLVGGIEGTLARYLAESLTPTLFPEDYVRILHESVRDRFAGYPNDGDEFVPFFDIDSQSNKYPVVGMAGRPLPLDWQIEANVNDKNYQEHVQDRWSWYDIEPEVSTASPFYVMQGMCDPSETDPTAFTFWRNCTEANNDVSTGGSVTPSPTSNQIYRKASSLSPILKVVYENHQNVRDVGIYFSNSGAGAGLNFPHYKLRTGVSYTSTGCEWMNKPNPYDPSRPIGTKDEIARCRPEGTLVSSRLYNPMERGWCRDQALNPFKPLVDGPYLDAWYGGLVMTVGQGIYDRFTNDFIGCMYIGWYLDNMNKILAESRFTENSEVSVARFDDGTTVGSTEWDASTATDTVKIYDINVGLTSESYEKLKTLIQYNTTWNPAEVREMYESFTLSHEGFLVTTYPMPPVPEVYDENYVPLFFVILSTSQEDVYQVVEDVKRNVDDHMNQVIYITLVVAAIGLGTVLLLIYLMSKAITAPLKYMNNAADEILNHFGSTSSSTKKIESVDPAQGCRWFPKTELDEVVKEFNKMVASFSGCFASAAKSVRGKREEIPNEFDMQDHFEELYESRNEAGFAFNVGNIGTGDADITQFFNLGSNIISDETDVMNGQNHVVGKTKHGKGGFTSRLFFWTVLLIGTPLLLTTIAISAIVMYNMSTEFQSSIDVAESFYLEVEFNALSAYASLRANVVSSKTSRPTRDLYILARYASWLLFGGLERAMSFTTVKTGIEQCKTFPDSTMCPFYEENYFCDCAWNDRTGVCNNYTFDTRHFQDLHFLCEASDTAPNGDRISTSFPNVAYSPESTVWWDDVNSLPGSEKGASASGYETTYDRLRVISASPVHQLVYNQDLKKEYNTGNNVAFEADGLFMAFFGCHNTALLGTSSWSSTEANGAYKIRPELCPIGKYGYDPRCREWYDTGKKLAEADGTPLYVTPPYPFVDSEIGQSATSPLIDPQTKEHVGQVLIDFLSGPILDSLNDKNTPLADGGFPILISTLSGPDSVIGPGFSPHNESAKPISELVLPYDHDRDCLKSDCELHIAQFEQILQSMKRGERGKTKLTRRSSADSLEIVYIAYAPVILKAHRPVDSSDFSRGVESREYSIYSLALAEPEGGLLEPFQQLDEDTNKQIKIAISILSVIIVLSILFVLYIMSVVTLSVSEPMLQLLDVIHSINRLNVNEEPPSLKRSNGSRELIGVSDTIQTLYKVVRCGNYAFFSGDLEKAYAVLHDASRLFHDLDNKKAIGVVSNNLGNLLLVMYRTLAMDGEARICGMTKQTLIDKGTGYFHEAIQLGEKAYDEFHEIEGWSPNCLDFMQHLSNRYFNRGIFLLTVKDAHTQPDELERLGLRDLEIARDLDMEIADAGLEAGWGHVTSVLKKFDVTLVRAKGHLVSQELGYPDNFGVGEMLNDAFMMVKREVERDTPSPLFQTVTTAGRLQEIETELIRYFLINGEVLLASQIGIRMLFEDEFMFPEAQEKALEALSVYIDSMDIDETKRALLNRGLGACQTSLASVLDDMDASRKTEPSENAKNLTNLTAVRRSIADSDFERSMSRRSSVRESQRGYLTMEEF